MSRPHPELSLVARCDIHPTATIHPFTNLYDSEIGEDSVVGKFVEVGGAKIGKRTRIATHSYICPGVSIGDDCFVGHGVMFTNDLFVDSPEYPDKKSFILRKTKIGNRVRIGSGAVILPIEIGDDCVIGSGAVVTKNVPCGMTVCGNPAMAMLHRMVMLPKDEEEPA